MTKRQAGLWAVGLLLGLVIGITVFGPKGGVGFGVAMGLAFALAFGAANRSGQDDTTRAGRPDGLDRADRPGSADPS